MKRYLKSFVRFFSCSTPRTIGLLVFVLIIGLGINSILPNQTLQSSQRIADTATTVTTTDATLVNSNSAVLNGTFTTTLTANANFKYGTSSAWSCASLPNTISGPVVVTAHQGGDNYIATTVLSGLSSSTTYYFCLVMVTTNESYGSVLSFTTAPAVIAPPPPTNVTATAVSKTQINLSWTAPTGELGYGDTMYLANRCTGTGCTSTTNNTHSLGANITSYSDSDGLSCSTTYGYSLFAIRANGTYTDKSPWVYATTSACADPTATPVCLAAGTIIEPFCETSGGACAGNIYADGACGTYRNCVDCPSNACSGTSCAPCPAPVISTRCCDGNVCQDATYTPSSCGGTVTKITTCSSGCVTDSSTAAHCKGTPSATPTPTKVLTPTPTGEGTPTPTGASTPTPIPTSAPEFTINLDVLLPGIGGDPWLGANINPLHPTRTFTIQILDGADKVVKEKETSLTFAGSSYKGSAKISGVTNGNYKIKVKSDNSLYKALPGVKQLATGTTTSTQQITLVTGNLDDTNGSKNLLDLSDYNLMISGYGVKVVSGNPLPFADLNDDGTVDSKDLNILLRGFAIRKGD